MSFGNILKKIRQDNNLTQEELAVKIDTSRSNIANYENDKNMPSVEVLGKLSNVLGCSIDYLLGKSDVRTPIDINEVKFANAGGLNVQDLDPDEIEEIRKQVEYMRWKKSQENTNGK